MRVIFLLTGAIFTGCQTPCARTEATNTPHTIALTDLSAGVSVEYTVGDHTRQAHPDSNGKALLFGLPPLTEVAWRLLNEDGALVCQDDLITPNLPVGLPQLSVTIHNEDRISSEAVFLGTTLGESATVFAVDREGHWLWHVPLEEGLIAVDVHIQGKSILHNVFAAEFTEDVGEIRWLNLAGEQTASLRTEGGHHVFEPTPDGTIAWPAVDIRDWYDEKREEMITIVGDRLMESHPDGTSQELFNVWDVEDPERHEQWSSGFYDQGFDWTHANGVSYSAERDSYLLSLGHVDAIYEIDRTTGAPIQRMDSDWVVRSHPPFAFQHDPHWTDDGTLMMLSYTDDITPVAIEYDVNTERGHMREIWSETAAPGGIAMLGQARRLENGNVFINYGGKGLMRELTPDGEIVWELSSSLGTWFGNVRPGDALF